MAEPGDIFFKPTYEGKGSSIDNEGDVQKYGQPGMPPMPGPAGGNLFTGGLGLISPILETLGKLAGLDQKIVNGITSSLGGVLSTRGSFSRPTNYGDIFNNAQTVSRNKAMFRPFETNMRAVQTDLLKDFYQNVMGFKPEEAENRAISGMKNFAALSPIVSNAAFGKFEFGQLRRGLVAGGMMGGATLGGAARSDHFGKYAAELVKEYGGNKFAFGGLSGGEVGQLQASMIQSGQLSLRDLGKGNNSQAMVQKVKRMSQAVAPLKELFGESIPQLMKELDDAFGVSTATFSPEQVSSKVLNLKHTAMATGLSVKTIMRMSASAQNMLGTVGESGMGADTAAEHAAMMMSTGVSMARLNTNDFRSRVLRDVTGQMASRGAHDISGAALLYRNAMGKKVGGGYKVSMQEAVNYIRKRAEGDYSVAKLAEITGTTAGDVIAAGESEGAEDIRTNTDVGAGLTETRYNTYKTVRAQGLRFMGRHNNDPLMSKAYEMLAKKLDTDKGAAMTEQEAKDYLKKSGLHLSSNQLTRLVSDYTKQGNVAAGVTGFKSARQADAQMKAYAASQEVAKRVEETKGIEAVMQKVQASEKYGWIGLLQGKQKSIGGIWKKAFGGLGPNLTSGQLEGLNENDKKLLNEQIKDLYTNMTVDEHGDVQINENIDKDKRKRLQRLYNVLKGGKASSAEIKKAQRDIFFNDTEEGKAATQAVEETVKLHGGNKEKERENYMEMAKNQRQKYLKGALLEKSIEGIGADSGAVAARFADYKKKAGKDWSVSGFLKSDNLDEDQRKKLTEQLEKNDQDFGLNMEKKPVDLLRDILAALETIKNEKIKISLF